MKTKPAGGTSAAVGSSSRSHSKRGSGSRERDKVKLAISGESGASSQCDTPPLTEKEGVATTPSVGRWAGLSAESILCVAEQLGTEINAEAAAALAEDASFKLRQLIHTVWVHSQLARRTRVERSHVDAALKLADTEPVLGAATPLWRNLGDDYFCEIDGELDTCELARSKERLTPATAPALTVQWVSDERSLAGGDLPRALRTYCTHICRAILKGSREAKAVALQELRTNPHVGPVLPNLLNLAVLVLNDDNLNTLHVPVKEPLKHIILDMLEALCANPCSLDTDVQKQLQRLYPAMVSDILSSGPLADKMINVVSKLARTWPAFLHIGEKTLYEYLSAGHPERVSGAVVRCLAALGRRALLRCLEPHLDHIDACLQRPQPSAAHAIHLPGAMLEASWLLVRPEPDTALEDAVSVDYTLYEMIGDAVVPRRLFYLHSDAGAEGSKSPTGAQDEDTVLYTPLRSSAHRPRMRAHAPRPRGPRLRRDAVFEPAPCPPVPRITLKVPGARPVPLRPARSVKVDECVCSPSSSKVVAACGMLVRFTYKLPTVKPYPIFAYYTL